MLLSSNTLEFWGKPGWPPAKNESVAIPVVLSQTLLWWKWVALPIVPEYARLLWWKSQFRISWFRRRRG